MEMVVQDMVLLFLDIPSILEVEEEELQVMQVGVVLDGL